MAGRRIADVRVLGVSAVAMLLGAVVGMAAERERSARDGVEQTWLLETDLGDFPGKKAYMFIGNFEPGARTGRHHHPGTEFLYVLEGHGVLEQSGRAPTPLSPGVAVYSEPDPEQPSFTHQAKNLSETERMRTLVVLIVDADAPTAIHLE